MDLFGSAENQQTAQELSASVLLPVPVPALDYRVPALQRGLLVSAKLSGRTRIGAVWGPASGEVPENKLKSVDALPGNPVLPPALCDFIDWVARYTLAPPGQVLAMALRTQLLDAEKGRPAYMRGDTTPEVLSKARQRVLAIAADGLARTLSDLAFEAGVTPSVIKGLVTVGALVRTELPEFTPLPIPQADFATPVLNGEQQAAADQIVADVRAKRFAASLLDGITGSGKTETYFEAVAESFRAGRQVLILLPEIALSVQFLDRFARRFGCRPAEWHSDMAPRQRRRVWKAVLSGEARAVVGARSGLFLPFPNLGLIIVDEEHDGAYKQEEGVIYNARDMAVVRAKAESCPVVLASATPSLESFTNAVAGRYAHLKLTERHGVAELPAVRLIDLRHDKGDAGSYISPPLREALKNTLAAGEQAMLFLNRRGFAPLTLCGGCGHKIVCKNCSAWLVEHRARHSLICHHCGYEVPIPKKCPECGEEGALIACGPGVERVAEEFHSLFPDAHMAVASSDTMDGPDAMQAAIRAMGKGEIDVMIGTQIVAKGHHFPHLTLVGVVDGDLGGSDGDPRARERSFQMLHQVSGRAGRAEQPGLVLIQTRNPEDAVMKALAAQDRDAFYAQEAEFRRRATAPPFGRLAALILSGMKEADVIGAGRMLANAAPRARGVRVWGPAPAFYALLRGRTRERLLVQADKSVNIQGYLQSWLSAVKIPATVRLAVDIDPVSFF
ncbi:MAG: primosomal protein N' [Rhizomicrobium sp.]